MKHYQLLKSYYLKIDPQSELIINNKHQLLVTPPHNSKVYLHWLTRNERLAATLTLAQPTLIQTPVTAVNTSDVEILLHVIELPKH